MNIIEMGFRIKQAIGLTGYNVKEFCEKTNRSRVTTALWISGRGGLIKDKSLEDFCFDLKKCNVSCHMNWIKFGVGLPPTLFTKNEIETPTNSLELDLLEVNIENICGYLKKYDNENYFEQNDNKYYAIASFIDRNTIDKFKNNLVLILTPINKSQIGILLGNCKASDTFVLSDLNNKIFCVSKNDISKIGKIVFYINKNI